MSNEQNRPPAAASDRQDKQDKSQTTASGRDNDNGPDKSADGSSDSRATQASSGAQDKQSKKAGKSRPTRPRSHVLPLMICLLLAGAIGWLAWNLEKQQQRIAELSGEQGQQQGQLDERFREEQARLDARISEQQDRLEQQLGAQQNQFEQRFGEQQNQIDQRFGEQQNQLDERIDERLDERTDEQLDARFDERFAAQEDQFVERFDQRMGEQQDQLDQRFEQRFSEQQDQLAGQLDERLEQQQAQRREELRVIEDMVGNLREALSETRSELETQTTGMAEIREQITSMRMRLENVEAPTGDEQVWMLAEVESMLRLAEQRLLMARDTRTAIALMQSADEILRDMDDSRLFPVREALADDIEALRGVPELDVEGGFVRLNSVMQRIEALRLRDVTREQLAAAETVEVPAEGSSTLDRWLRELGELVSVRRLDEPLQGNISTEQGHFIRQNIRLLLEQAQLALWRGEEDIYTGNIDQAVDYMQRYFLTDDAAFRAAIEALEELRERPVAVEIPPASSGLTALRRVMETYERGDESPTGAGNNGQ